MKIRPLRLFAYLEVTLHYKYLQLRGKTELKEAGENPKIPFYIRYTNPTLNLKHKDFWHTAPHIRTII